MAVAGILPALAPGLAAGANPVRVEAHNERGFGRLVLDFERMPAYRSELSSGVLVLSFDQPVDADLTTVTDEVPSYIAVARRDPDGRALRMALSRSFRINVMEAGSALYIDLLPPEWTGPPPPLPLDVVRELGRRAQEAEEREREEARQRASTTKPYTLDIRLARYPTFTRVVFDWNQFVTVGLTRKGGEVTLAFDRQAPANLSRLKVDGPHFLRSAFRRELERGMEITLVVDEDVDVRGFREGLAYILDLTGPDAALDAAGRQAADIVDAAASGRTAAPADSTATDELRVPGARQQPDAPRGPAPPLPGPELRITEPGQMDLDALLDHDPDNQAPASVAPAPDAGQPLIAGADASAFGRRGATPEATRPARANAGDAVAVAVERTGENLKLVFPFSQSVAAAAFRRGRHVWLVFDSETPLDVQALREAVGPMIAEVTHQRSGAMQYFVIELVQPWLSYMDRKEYAWVVNIGNMVTGRAQPLRLIRALRDDRLSMLRVELEKPGRVHWLTDPLVGDRLAVVTAHGPPRSVPKRQDLVDLLALATAHGLAIRPNADDLAVRLGGDEVLITRQQGLALSAGFARQYVPGRKGLEETGRAGFVEFAAWRESEPARLSRRIAALQAEAATGPEAQRQARRLDLARLYLANGFAAESLGVMRQMRAEDAEVASDPAFNALRAAALTLMGRPEDARKDLEVHALINDPHAALWRGLAAALRQDRREALRAFEEGAAVIGAYPPDMQARFRLAAARAALELEDPIRAALELESVPRGELPRELAAERRLVQGRYFDRVGRTGEALEAYDAVLAGDHAPAKAEARLSKIKLLLHTERMSQAEAIGELELLQLLWRGDHIELRAMRKLADLYVRQDRYRDAFEIMRTAVLSFPESGLAHLIQDDMKQVFQDLFLRGASDKLRPVDALALYYEFRDLTPVGRLGDDMIRQLTDRLISVDLLDQAAELLDHQVEKRLSGVARAQVATRLAMVHLMNRKPELALRAIRRTRQAGLPVTLLHSRYLLEARALGELGRAEAAIEILNAVEGAEAEWLKADALWNAQKWKQAGEQMEKLLGTRWKDQSPLTERERIDVLRAAISYSLADDQFALDRLRKKFHEHMRETADAESFALVTEPVQVRHAELRSLVKQIAITSSLEAFLREFRARYDRPPESQPGGETG